MVCEYNSNVLTALSLAINWSDYEEGYKEGEGGYDEAGAN
jgi:hypothetical protein